MNTSTMTLPRWVGNKLALLILGAGLVFASIFAFTQNASAALSNCGTSPERVCMWVDSGYNGLQADFYGGVPGCYNVGPFNDMASSLANFTSRSVTFYPDANCAYSFWRVELGPWQTSSNLSWGGMNDIISSFRIN